MFPCGFICKNIKTNIMNKLKFVLTLFYKERIWKKRKIKDIFIDYKIKKEERDNYPIVVDSLDRVIWIPKLKKSKYDVQNRELCDIIFKCL